MSHLLLSKCRDCDGMIQWFDPGTGGWWAHADHHPADDHGARPLSAVTWVQDGQSREALQNLTAWGDAEILPGERIHVTIERPPVRRSWRVRLRDRWARAHNE